MTVQELKAFYGDNQAEIGRKLGLHRATISYWVRRNHIPYNMQHRIQEITRGKLKAG